MAVASEVCEPNRWDVVLNDGSVVSVWADSAEGLAGEDDLLDHRFCKLLDVPFEHQHHFEIVGRTPINPERIIVTVAVFPRTSVREVR
ncbi:MAG: hypothetical protein JWP74_3476 [Marmoricola sp.]|nr:hypothetical protein [Marmoricola sp.]